MTGFLTSIREIVQRVTGCDDAHGARDAGRQAVSSSVCVCECLEACSTPTLQGLGGYRIRAGIRQAGAHYQTGIGFVVSPTV